MTISMDQTSVSVDYGWRLSNVCGETSSDAAPFDIVRVDSMSKDKETDSTNFWHQYLFGKQSTRLPTIWRNEATPASPTAPIYSHESASVPYVVPKEVALSAWASVLSLFTASEEVAFGVTLEGGCDGTQKATVKFPFCLDLSSEHGSKQTVQRVADSIRNVQDHAYSSDVQSINSDEELSTFQRSGTLLQIYQPNSCRSNANGDVEHADIPIRIVFRPCGPDTEIMIHFRQEFYVHNYVAEILRQTQEAIARLRDGSSMFQQTDLGLVLSWTQSCEPVPKEPLLHAGIERQSRLSPNAIAIGQSESVMTYRELNRGADLFADSLLADVSTCEEVRNVGIYFEKSSFAIMSMLGVLKAGHTYVPLDVAWPAQRIAVIIKDAKISTVFCSSMQSSNLRDHPVRIVVVDEKSVYQMKQRSFDQQRRRNEINPANAAYMLYTSGSTGLPKGIPVSHTAISTSIQAMARRFNTNNETRTFQYTTFTFDLNIADIWMTLSCGGRVCLPTEEERLSPNEFIAQERCNYAMITPTATSTIDNTILHRNIKTLALIGETVPEHLLRGLATSDGSLKLYNTWGPTEASVIASCSENITVKDDSSLLLHPNDIGCPIGCSIFIVSLVNPHLLAAAFAPGEIALVGDTLANGYYGNPGKTEEAFRTDLAWTKNEALISKVGTAAAMRTVYLTGDIGRYNPNGNGSIIFMHRKEGGYVKINGYRVDPGEVEAKISDAGLTRRGVCVLTHEQSDIKTKGPRQMLVCFFVAGDSQATPGSGYELCEFVPEIRLAVQRTVKQLRESMSEYMIPRLFIPMEYMPILTSHKIDRKVLLGILDDHSWPDLVKRYGD